MITSLRARMGLLILAFFSAARTFDQTLWTFINGGQAPYLPGQMAVVPATRQSQILASLRQIHHTWGTFRGYLETIIATDPESPNFGSALQAVEDLSPNLVRQADEVVRMYGEIAALCLLDKGDQALHLEALSGPREALGGARVSARHPL